MSEIYVSAYIIKWKEGPKHNPKEGVLIAESDMLVVLEFARLRAYHYPNCPHKKVKKIRVSTFFPHSANLCRRDYADALRGYEKYFTAILDKNR